MQEKLYPIVEYARLIGKNTAEFTASDMSRFMDWCLAKHKKGGKKMNYEQWKNNKKNQPSKTVQIEEEVEVQDQEEQQEIVCEFGLTAGDVEALKWGLTELLTAYDFSELEDIGSSLQSIKEVLDGIE